MDHTLSTPVNFKGKKLVVLLSLAAAALVFLAQNIFSLYAMFNYGMYSVFNNFFSNMLQLAPPVILALYFLFFHDRNKLHILLPISFIAFAFYEFYSNILQGSTTLDIVVTLLLIVPALTLAAINGFKGFSNKIFSIISVAMGLTGVLIYYIEYTINMGFYIDWLIYDGHPTFITYFMIIAAQAAFFAVIFLYSLNGKKADGSPAGVVVDATFVEIETVVDPSSPENRLRVLRDEFEFGVITEEEYTAKCAEITAEMETL